MTLKPENFAVVLVASLMLAACTVNPATGKKEFTPFMTPSQEAQIGAEENPKLVAEFGGEYQDTGLGAYVEQLGDQLAARSEMPDTDFDFTVLNSPVVNAFALPGGYVSVSRGILAYFNDEAEMASVLGHEIGHVTARHAANRYNRAVFAGLGGTVIGEVAGSDLAGSLLGTGAQLYLLSYSRGQESQADGLGLRYVTRTGHDPQGSVRMLETLQTYSNLEAQKSGGQADQTPNWARTHPLTADRIRDQQARVDALEPKPASAITNRDRYLNAIDGMLYGDDPEQGIIKGRDFLHKGYRLAFTAPQGFTLHNTASAVIGAGPDNVRFLFAGGVIDSDISTAHYLEEAWASLFDGPPPKPLSNVQQVSTNGMSGLTGAARLESQGGALDVRMYAWRYDTRHAFHFALVTPASVTGKYAGALQGTAMSFRKLSDSEAAALKPLRIKIITVQAGDTISSLARRMAVDSYQEELFRVLNNLNAGDALQPGQRLKLVVEGE